MKHLKLYEEQKTFKEWIIIQNQSSKSNFLLHITDSDKNYVYYDKYIILTMKDTYLDRDYLSRKNRANLDNIHIVFQSDNESDCIKFLEKIIEINIKINKFNKEINKYNL